MDFAKRLNAYIAETECSAKMLADASGVSAAAISRYRTGDRTPDPDSKQLRMLARGIVRLSGGTLSEQDVHDELAVSISGISVDYGTYLANVSALLSTLSINNNELARALSFDPSYISRILSGRRRPADLQLFTNGIAHYAARRSAAAQPRERIVKLTGMQLDESESESSREQAIVTWLKTNYAQLRDPLGGFLERLDSFDLDDFIRAIHFNDVKTPIAPVQLPTTKVYSGIREMMACELDFLKAVVTSRSSADVIMYSDMPLEEMAADEEFPKKWMYGMAAMLKKGLRLHMIHDANRPLDEMMLGLESWIPMYMTGQISPYYLEKSQSGVFCHLLKVSGTAAMQGEAIAGYQGEGRYVLTKSRDEVRYYRNRAERMLEKAMPLMRILTKDNSAELATFLENEAGIPCRRRFIMSTLPLGIMPPDLLERILARNDMPEAQRQAIRELAATRRLQTDGMTAEHTVVFEVPDLTEDEFAEHPISLDLSGAFIDKPIRYGYGDYLEHLNHLKAYAENAPNCQLVADKVSAFRNTQIMISEGRNVLVSKNKGPVIHFVIEHPGMVAAFAKFSAPVSE